MAVSEGVDGSVEGHVHKAAVVQDADSESRQMQKADAGSAEKSGDGSA